MFENAMMFLLVVAVAPTLVDLTVELVRYWNAK